MPALERRRQSLAERGIELIGVHVGDRDAAAVQHYVESVGATYPMLVISTDEAARLFGAAGVQLPLSVAVDGDGRITGAHLGADREGLEALLQAEPTK